MLYSYAAPHKEVNTVVNTTIDRVRSYDMSKIYCKCGNIVSIDKNTVKLKKILRKNLECAGCRNHRISGDIEYLNSYYDGTLDDVQAA